MYIWDLPCNGMCEKCDLDTDDCPIQSEACNAAVDYEIWRVNE